MTHEIGSNFKTNLDSLLKCQTLCKYCFGEHALSLYIRMGKEWKEVHYNGLKLILIEQPSFDENFINKTFMIYNIGSKNMQMWDIYK